MLYSLSNFPQETSSYDQEDSDYEEHSNFGLSDISDSIEQKFWSRKKKRNKKMEKKSHKFKITIHSRKDPILVKIRARNKGWKGNKRNYGQKCKYILPGMHENILEDINTPMVTPGNCLSKIIHSFKKYLALQTFTRTEMQTMHTTTKSSSFYIVQDLLVQVISRLPLKSRARFKCVSKQWQGLISNEITVTNTPKLLFFLLTDSCLNKHFNIKGFQEEYFLFLSIDYETRIGSMCSPMEDHLLRGQEVKAHCSCNGLLLIQISTNLFVWNPLTKFIRKVLTHGYFNTFRYMFDLCFDYANDEYKVMLVDSSKYFSVATFGASSWQHFPVHYTFRIVSPGPFFKGYRHWISKDHLSNFEDYPSRYDGQSYIVYFNPSTYKFIAVPMSQAKTCKSNAIVGLGVLDGYLCMSRLAGPENYEATIEFLAMKEYGNGDSWETMFVFPSIPEFCSNDIFEPLFQTKEGQVLVRHKFFWNLVSYKFKTKDGQVLVRHKLDSGESVKVYDADGNFIRDILGPVDGYSFNVIPYEETAPDMTGENTWKVLL